MDGAEAEKLVVVEMGGWVSEPLLAGPETWKWTGPLFWVTTTAPWVLHSREQEDQDVLGGADASSIDVEGPGCSCVGSVVPGLFVLCTVCLLYTSPSPRDLSTSRMPSSA